MKKKQMIFLLFLLLFVIIYLFTCIQKPLLKNAETFINIYDKPDELTFGKDNESKIPNKIWSFWHSDHFPYTVNECINSWKKYNPNYDIVVLNKKTLKTYLPDLDFEKLPRAFDYVQRFADYVRIYLLSKYGGLWVDASIMCNQSFGWINAIQNKFNCECICYYLEQKKEETSKTSPSIENWFIASVPNSQFINDWKDEFVRANDFATPDLYIKDIKNKNIDISRVHQGMLTYLLMNCSAQVILQQNPNKYNLCCFDANIGPFKFYINDNNANQIKSIDTLLNKEKCKKYYNIPIIKLTQSCRQELENRQNKEDIKFYINSEE